MGVEANTIRVTLHRLLKDGDAKSEKRGRYSLGEKRRPLYKISQEWAELPSLTRVWEGDWIVVHTAHLGKQDRPAKRVRERALNLHGFTEALNGFWCRPNNLLIDNNRLCKQLYELGLERSAVITESKMLGENFKDRISSLWDTGSLERGYVEGREMIRESLKNLRGASASLRSQHTFQLLNTCFKFLASDPLLPPEFINERLRNDFYKALVKYDQFGRTAWADFYREEELATEA